jgi:thymidylate kinase
MRDSAIDAAGMDSPVVDLLLALLVAFQEHGIRYCYWRSRRRIHAALSGDSDLDLLIAREDRDRAHGILLGQGFKAFPCVAHRDHPAISSFLGYDEPSGLVVHVHAHFRLVIGDKLLNQYRLPWEDVLLARAVTHPQLPIRVLDPASEALVMVVRSCVELRRTDPITLRHWQSSKLKFERDRVGLADQLGPDELRRRAREVFSDEVADLVTDAVFSGRALETQSRLRRRVRQALAERRAYNTIEGRLRSCMRAMLWALGGVNDRLLHAPRPWSRRVPGGGCVVAVVGVDGSGKSTAVRSIRSWLGTEVDVIPIYFGTGDGRPSLLLLPFKLLSIVIARLMKTRPKGSSHGHVTDRDPGPLYSVLLMGWAAAVAMEKRGKLLAARRGADRGLVVVADRYPQNEDPAYSDGPMLHRLKWSPQWLRRLETRTYELAGRLPPDLVIKLEVPAATLARREPDMNAEVIRQRIEGFRRLAFSGARTVLVNAAQPLADVSRTIRREVWRML